MKTDFTETERGAILTLCVMAAYADGDKSERERAEVRRIVEGLRAPHLNPALIYQEALTQPQRLADIAVRLETPAARAMAYEMAVCICDADDVLDAREKAFLEQLRAALGQPASSAAEFQTQAETMAAVPLAATPGTGREPLEPPVLPPEAALQPPTENAQADQDKMILHYAILNGALELLPQTLATMAIIPLQMKMVYRLGKAHGYELDRGHIRDLLATAGLGMTSQVVEGYARKLLGGLLGKFAGGKVGKLGKSVAEQAASSAFSFTTTYALGQVAKQYYAGGRRIASVQLKELFSASLAEAKTLHGRYLPQIQDRVKTINPVQLLPLIKGQ